VAPQRSNPHPCGYFNDPTRECTCTPPMIQRYVSKISGPLLDRIDIHIDMPAVKYRELRNDAGGEASEQIRVRVVRARQRQLSRYQGEKIFCIAQMGSRQIHKYCNISRRVRAAAGNRHEPPGTQCSGPRPHLEGAAYDRRLGGCRVH